MATEPAQINLDDIFGAIPILDGASAPYPDSVHHSSVIRSESHHSAVKSHVSSSQVYIPPEPKSRASTVQSKTSSISTVKHEPEYTSSHPASYAIAAPVPAPRESANTPNVNLLDSVFDAVALPPVHYEPRYDDHSHVIDEIDAVLALEETDGGLSSSERSYKGQSHSNYSSHQDAHRVVADNITNSYNGLNLNGRHHNGSRGSHDYYDEMRDSFEPAHLPYIPGKEGHRSRAMTIDSQASAAETRYGGFFVHDDNDQYTSQEIDLHHNEVAYTRPKKVSKPPVASIAASGPIHTGSTIKLQQINREVADAHRRKELLLAQIERAKAENERLIQKNLAKEAAMKVGPRYPPSKSSTAVSESTYTLPNSRVRSSSGAQSNYHHNGGHSSHGRSSTVTTTTVTPAKFAHQNSIYEEEPARISQVAQDQLNHGQSLGRVGKINLVVPQMEEVQGFSKNSKINKIVVGGHALPTEDDKCVLLFGPVGSGKTSSISSMLNYLYDVKKENNFRFVLDSEHKSTHGLTAYVVNNSILPYSITLIDTPGVVDEKNNKTVSTLIKQWFEQELLDAGAFRIDAISIILRHDEDNLGWPFIYELAAVKRMFGDDLKTNVLPIITHTEVLPQPLAVRSLALANIAFVEYYKLNNVGFEPEARGITKLQHNLYFSHGIASLELFFRDLQELIHPLLAVLRSPAGIRSAQNHSYDGTALY